MTENQSYVPQKKKIGRPRKHGAYLIRKGQAAPDKRQRADLRTCRERIIQDLGPTEADLPMTTILLLDRAMTYLAAARAIELWVSSHGFMDAAGQVNPAINDQYLAFCNGLIRCLQLLGFSRRRADDLIDLGLYKEERIKEKAAKRAQDEATCPQDAQDGRPDPDQGNGQGEGGDDGR